MGEERRKQGKKDGRKREKEGERLRVIQELEKTLGKIKGSVKKHLWKYKEWSLYVVFSFFIIICILCVFFKEVVCDECFDF